MAGKRSQPRIFSRWLFGRGGMKRMILFPFLGLIVVGTLSCWLLYTAGSQAIVIKAVDALVLESAGRTRDRIVSYLDGVAKFAREEAAVAQMRELPPQRLRAILWRLVHDNPDVDIAAVGSSRGEYIEAERQADGTTSLGLAGLQTGGTLVKYASDSSGSLLRELARQARYDPRDRPWYTAAASADGPVWVKPYVLQLSGQLTATVSVPIRDESGHLSAVAGVALKLAHLEKFLSEASRARGAFICIVDSAGGILAASGDSPSMVRKLPSLILSSASNHGSVIRVAINEERYRLVTLDAELAEGLPWRVAVALPEAEFLSGFSSADRVELFALFALILAAIAVAFISAHRIAMPLQRLGDAVSATQPLVRDSEAERSIAALARRDDEIGHLAGRFSALSQRLDMDFMEQRRSIEEKELLLRELNHRVKNNLQIISSLVSSQIAAAAEGPMRDGLLLLDARIQTMAYIHEDLCVSGDTSSVDMDYYFERICDSLAAGISLVCPVAIKVERSGFAFPASLAMPCGLIVNELVTNSIRHAFIGRASGSIAISLSGPEGYLLVVADDGVGCVADSREKGMGQGLVEALAAQLGGSSRIECGSWGTKVTVSFQGPQEISEPSSGSS
jgi:two-component sensor histidine kinase